MTDEASALQGAMQDAPYPAPLGHQPPALRDLAEGIGPVDIIVNNAGITHLPGAAETIIEADFDRIFQINMKAIYLMTQAFTPGSKARPTAVLARGPWYASPATMTASCIAAITRLSGVSIEGARGCIVGPG